MDWKPSATRDVLVQRANILKRIRRFFEQRNVLEVETPSLSSATVTDVHLHCFDTEFNNPLCAGTQKLYLQTSPEFAMKRMLCSGSGAIYQICKAFRNEEAGSMHNPEFSMLEWYRPGFNHIDLMQEVDELTQCILGCESAEHITYQQAFIRYLALDPLDSTVDMLAEKASVMGFNEISGNETNPDTLLQLLFSQIIEPQIGQLRPCFISGFPASQAALAKIDPEDNRIARRFELYFKGIELANGFHELSDPLEQRARFEKDNLSRIQIGLKAMPVDHHLIDALDYGLPDCAGVALGLDRLIMLALGKSKISDVLSFSVYNA